MHISTTSRNSRVAALLVNQDRVFSLEAKSPALFDRLVSCATTGFPRALLVSAKQTLDEAVKNGETLSRRSDELLQLVNKQLKVPALMMRH